MQLCQSEWTVLQSLWERQPQTLMQLVEDLKLRAGWSASTSKTMAARMTEKGLLRYEGKPRRYYPNVTREEPGWRKPSSCFPARSAGSSVCWSAISLTTEKSERMNLKNSMPFWTRLRAARNRGGELCWNFSFHRLF